MTDGLMRIPRRFYDDHCERDLPTPVEHKGNKKHVWVRKDDPAFAELIDDARYYANRFGPDGAPHISAAARALLKSVEG